MCHLSLWSVQRTVLQFRWSEIYMVAETVVFGHMSPILSSHKWRKDSSFMNLL